MFGNLTTLILSRRNNLLVIGKVDDATLEMMATPRCGNTERPVVEIIKPGNRQKRFAYNGEKMSQHRPLQH